MHAHSINAQLQLVPLAAPLQALAQIDKAIAIIRQSGLPYQVGPFGTSVEGNFSELVAIVDRVNSLMAQDAEAEWLWNIQLHMHAAKSITADSKTAAHNQ